VLTLKKLSARRKNPSRSRFGPRTARRNRWSSDSDRRVANRKFLVPPSALNPATTAIASMRVDFPEPFSPTRQVTLGARGNSSSARTAGMENG